MPDGSATAHIYRPKIATVLAEGYNLDCFRRDMLAALTVAIVALPLSMAIAVASGVSPERGLYAAVIGGFLVSALGGSRYQIGGPAGAFIVLVAATVTKFGLDGLLLTVFLSGFMLTLIGLLRLGSLIRYIPHAVTVGFTCGIAVTIFASQLKDLGGLKLPGAEPGQLLPKLAMLGQALPTISMAALAVGVGSAALIFLLRRLLPNWPGMLIAVMLASLVGMAVPFAGPDHRQPFWPTPGWRADPPIAIDLDSSVLAVLPTALSFTLLGAVESLLSAKVADGMTGRKHRYNMEVVAQGVANVASAIFGGISVTGTIARTATNIRAGGCSPVSGIAHAVFVLVFMLVAGPLASFIPLSALAGVLVVVCWNMAEKEDFLHLLHDWRGGSVLMATFGLTLIEDLTVGIIAGCVLAAAFAAFDRVRQWQRAPS